MALIARDATERRAAGRRTQRTRRLLACMMAALIGLASGPRLLAKGVVPGNTIQLENQNGGTPGWFSTNKASNHEIEGYVDHVSAAPGDTVNVFVSTQYTAYHVRLFRLGYYGGIGARIMADAGWFPGTRQPTPSPDPSTGLLECNWVSQASITIGSDWTTGLYLFRLDGASGLTSYIPLVVRANVPGDVLFQSSTTTFAAYNDWGGESLYGTLTGMPSRRHAYVVSFDRPYSSWDDQDAPGSGQELVWEYPIAYWLEQQGYNVSYTTDNDTSTNPSSLLSSRVFLAAGHDEYWSKAIRSAVIAARDSGVNLLFLSSNTGFRHIRFADSPLGANRRVICYKQDAYTLDPLYGVDNSDVTVEWSNKFTDEPENSILGVMNESVVFSQGGYAPFNWLTYTGEFSDLAPMTPATSPVITGVEYDCQYDNQLTPPGEQVLASSPLLNSRGVPGEAQAVRYVAPSGAIVFSAGTFAFGWGLDNVRTRINGVPDETNSNSQAILGHILSDMLSNTPSATPSTPASPPVGIRIWPDQLYLEPGGSFWLRAAVVDHHEATGLTWNIVNAPAWASITSGGFVKFDPSAPDGATIRVSCQSPTLPGAVAYATVTVDAPRYASSQYYAGLATPAYVDGSVSSAQFSSPVGIASDNSGTFYVTDSAANAVRVISGGNVSTLAGGPTSPILNTPSGIAYCGTFLVVSDTYHHLVRRIGLDGSVTTLAGTGSAGMVDGPALSACFNMPTGIAVDSSGNIYVADSGNHAIREITASGSVITVAGNGKPGLTDGSGAQSQLYFPFGLCWASTPSIQGLVIADSGNHAIRLLRADGSLVTIAGSGVRGYQDGAAGQAQFDLPAGVGVMPYGSIWITDERNQVVRVFDTRTGQVTTVLGEGWSGTRAESDRTCQFSTPMGICITSSGHVFVSDISRIQRVSPSANPTTTISLLGASGQNGWYTGPVTMTLRGTAPLSATGVQATYYNLDNQGASVYSSPLSFSSEGAHTVQFWTVDSAGDVESTHTANFGIDVTAPVTTASLSGTQGSNGYYTTPVTVSLNSSDNLSGVAATYYQIDGGVAQRYSGSFRVSSDGARSLVFWSVDQAGNPEAQHAVTIPIDQTLPTISASATPATLSANTGTASVVVSGSMSDNYSGVNTSTASYHVVDSYGKVKPAGSVTLGPNGSFSFNVQLDTTTTGAGPRSYAIWLSVSDQAGNIRQTSISMPVK